MPSRGAAILSQIEGLLEQYLAEGEDTPFYDQAQQMLSQIQPVLGRGAGQGADPMAPDAESTIEDQGEPAEEPADFASARGPATAALEQMTAQDKEGGLDNLKRKKKAKAQQP